VEIAARREQRAQHGSEKARAARHRDSLLFKFLKNHADHGVNICDNQPPWINIGKRAECHRDIIF
jgi:hypothetical protein